MKVPVDYAIYISFYILYCWQMSLYSLSSSEELFKLIEESNQKCQYDKSTKRNEKKCQCIWCASLHCSFHRQRRKLHFPIIQIFMSLCLISFIFFLK